MTVWVGSVPQPFALSLPKGELGERMTGPPRWFDRLTTSGTVWPYPRQWPQAATAPMFCGLASARSLRS